MIPADYVLFACPDDDKAESDARAYIRRYHLTQEDVKMIRVSGMMIVKTRRGITLKKPTLSSESDWNARMSLYFGEIIPESSKIKMDAGLISGCA